MKASELQLVILILGIGVVVSLMLGLAVFCNPPATETCSAFFRGTFEGLIGSLFSWIGLILILFIVACLVIGILARIGTVR